MGKKLTRQQVAKLYQLPLSTLSYLVSTKQIPFIRIGTRLVRFDEDDLKEWESTRREIEYKTGRQSG